MDGLKDEGAEGEAEREAGSTDIKAGHAVAVPWIPQNFWGGRDPAVAVAGSTSGSDGRRFQGVMAVGGHVSVVGGARGSTGVAAGRWGWGARRRPRCRAGEGVVGGGATCLAAGRKGRDYREWRWARRQCCSLLISFCAVFF